MDLLKIQAAKMETRTIGVEDCAGRADQEAVRLKQEMPQCLEEKAVDAVEKYKKSDAFDMDAAIAWCSMFMVVFSSIETFLRNIDANFLLEKLFCMKDYLTLQAREMEAEEEDSSS